jgi:hypothetical protein
MATESIGKTIYLDDEAADRLIAAIEYKDAYPSRSQKQVTPWGDPQEFMRALDRKFSNGKRA